MIHPEPEWRMPLVRATSAASGWIGIAKEHIDGQLLGAGSAVRRLRCQRLGPRF